MEEMLQPLSFIFCWCLPLAKPKREPEQSILGVVVHRAQSHRAQHKLESRPGEQVGNNKHTPACDRLHTLVYVIYSII